MGKRQATCGSQSSLMARPAKASAWPRLPYAGLRRFSRLHQIALVTVRTFPFAQQEKIFKGPTLGNAVDKKSMRAFRDCSARRMEDYGLSDRQSTDASDRAVDSRVVLVRTNDRLQHFRSRTC